MIDNTNTSAKWLIDPSVGDLPYSFEVICNEILTPAGVQVNEPRRESEGDEYGAVQVCLNETYAVFRQAKRTPKKTGQFLTLWKRGTPDSEITPIDESDNVEWVMIASDEGERYGRYGIFLFHKSVMVKKGIFSSHHVGGKRAFRVYGPWTTPTASQAQRTKKWQNQYFYEFVDGQMEEIICQITSRITG